MKKVIAIGISILLLLGLCACQTADAPKAAESAPVSTEDIEQNTNAPLFAAWAEAEKAYSERYMYETIIEGLFNSDDEMERGWIDDGTEQLIRLIKGSSVPDDASAKELIALYRGMDKNIEHTDYCIRDFFTVDEYNQSINTGIYNFLDCINQLEKYKFNGKDVVFTNDNGGITGWDFSAAGGDAEIAKALGVSEELVLIIQHAAIDAGFSVTFE